MCIGVSAPLKNNTLFFYSFLPISPLPLNLLSVKAPFLCNSLSLYWFFVIPPLKTNFSVNPHNIKIVHP